MTDEITGTSLLRQAVAARIGKPGGARLSRDLGIGLAALESFSQGETDLDAKAKTAIAAEVFSSFITWDRTTDRLKSTNTAAATPLAPCRPPAAEAQPVNPPPRSGPLYSSGPRPEPTPPRRPGWT